MKTFTVAKVLIVNEQGKVLVLRRSQADERRPGQWDFPGGWVEDGEEVRVAAIRETQEEAGIVLHDARLIFGMSDVTEYGSGTWIIFTASVRSTPEVVLSYEHDQFVWMDPQEMLASITYDRQQKMLAYIIEHQLLEES